MKKSSKNQDCDNCKYYSYCNCGCPKYRIIEKNGENHSYYCKAYKLLFNEAHDILQNLSVQWKEDAIKSRKGKYFDATDCFN